MFFRPAPPPGFTREEVAGLLCLAVLIGAAAPVLAIYFHGRSAMPSDHNATISRPLTREDI